jgi:hypothetical protein
VARKQDLGGSQGRRRRRREGQGEGEGEGKKEKVSTDMCYCCTLCSVQYGVSLAFVLVGCGLVNGAGLAGFERFFS